MILQNYLKKLPKHLVDDLPDFDFGNIDRCTIRRRMGRRKWKPGVEIVSVYYKDGSDEVVHIINRDYYVSYGHICAIADLISHELAWQE